MLKEKLFRKPKIIVNESIKKNFKRILKKSKYFYTGKVLGMELAYPENPTEWNDLSTIAQNAGHWVFWISQLPHIFYVN